MLRLLGLYKYKNLSPLKKNVLSGTISAGGSFVLLLIAYPLYLKYLGAERYGLWAAISTVVFFSRLGNLGINNALIKYVAEKFGQQDFRAITNYTTTSFYILVLPSVLILVLLFLFNENIAAFLDLKPEYLNRAHQLIPLTGILTVFILFVELVKGVLMGIGRIDVANYIFLLGRLIQVIISVGLIIAGLGVWGLYYGTAALYLAIFCVYLYFIHYRYRVSLIRINGFRKGYMKNLLAFGGTMFSATIISMLMQPFNKVIIARYIGLSEVAYYEIALRGAAQLRSLYEMGLKAVMPKVSELQQKSQNFRKAVRNIHDNSVKFILIFALPVFIGLFVLSNILLPVWLGHNYDPQISTGLRWFLFGYIVNLLSVPSFYIFSGINKVRLCFYAVSLSSFAHSAIILCFIFAGCSVTFNLIIIVNSFAIIAGALFLMITYYLKIDRYVIQHI